MPTLPTWCVLRLQYTRTAVTTEKTVEVYKMLIG